MLLSGAKITAQSGKQMPWGRGGGGIPPPVKTFSRFNISNGGNREGTTSEFISLFLQSRVGRLAPVTSPDSCADSLSGWCLGQPPPPPCPSTPRVEFSGSCTVRPAQLEQIGQPGPGGGARPPSVGCACRGGWGLALAVLEAFA